ncbi:hypothetical protein KXD40_007281 [Peronospora effusa]|nr:hypothetical protein KXD40_007281 [Peronospora effusa]
MTDTLFRRGSASSSRTKRWHSARRRRWYLVGWPGNGGVLTDVTSAQMHFNAKKQTGEELVMIRIRFV